MASNPYVSFMVEDPYQKAAREAEQRAQLAEMLQQQAFQPFEARPAPISRTEGITKLLAAALAGLSKGEQREAAQRARMADIEQATSELERIAAPGKENINIRDLLGLQPEDLSRVQTTPGKLEISATAPEFNIADTGEITGYKPAEITAGELGAPVLSLPEMTPVEKRAAYIRMLGGGPVSQAFGQMGIEQLAKKPEIAEFGTTVNYDAAGNAFVVNKAGQIQYLEGVTKPKEKPKIGVPGFDRFTAESLKKYEETDDESVLVDRPAPAKEVDQGALDARRFRQEDTLRGAFENRTKTYRDEVDATDKVIELQRDLIPGEKLDPIAQQSIVTLLNKFLDPNSVVREGEFDRTARGQGMIRQAALLRDKLLKGDFIDKATIDQITNLSRSYQRMSMGKIRGIANEYKDLAIRRNLDVESVILNPAYLIDTEDAFEPTPARGGQRGRRRRIPGAPPPSSALDVDAANAIVRGGGR